MAQAEILKFIKKRKDWVSATEIKKHFKKTQDRSVSTINQNLFNLHKNRDVKRKWEKEKHNWCYYYKIR